jgi:hypothetical protein
MHHRSSRRTSYLDDNWFQMLRCICVRSVTRTRGADAGSGALVPKGFFRGHCSRACSLKVAVSGDSVVCLCLLSMPLSNQAGETQKRFGHDDFMDVRQLSPLATTD